MEVSIDNQRTARAVPGRKRPSGLWGFSALLMVVMLVAVACGGGGGEGTSPPAGGTGSPPAGTEDPGTETEDPGTETDDPGAGGLTPPDTAQNLTLWNPFTGPDGGFFNEIVTDFNEATPNCQIEVATQPGAEYISRLEAAASASQLPHIIAAGYDALPGLAENDIVVPIADLADQAGLSAEDFPEAIWNASIWKDERYGVPIDTHPMVFFYNRALFEEAGLDPENPPADAESFEAAIAAINENTEADGYQLVATGPGANFLVGIQFATLFYQGGGEWVSDDFSEATFNSQAGIDAAQYLGSLPEEHGVPLVESDAEINAFQQAQNAMVFSGIWESTRYNDALGEDLGVAPVPQFFGPGVWGGSHNLAVTAAADADPALKQCAYYFINWFSENSLQWAAAGQVPARNDVREEVIATGAEGEGLLPIIAQAAPMAESVQFLPTIPGGGDLLFTANGAGEAAVFVINGAKSAEDALNEAARFNTEALVTNKDRYGF